MRALITGVTGFVGLHLSEFLVKKGFVVFGIDRNCEKTSDGKCKTPSRGKLKGVTLFSADITDKKRMCEIVKESKPDFIFHLAALSSIKSCREQPILAKQINVNGTDNLLSACIKNKINPKILIPSSALVYGIPKYLPVDESHPVSPVDEYGKSKVEQEKAAMKFFKKHSLNIIISRSFNHIGPNQSTGFVCSDFAKQIAEIEHKIKEENELEKENEIKEPIISVGDLSVKRDFTDVRDVVRAYLLLLEKGTPGEVYNVGSGTAYVLKDILKKLVSKSNIKIKIVENKDLFRKSDVPVLVANNKKFVKITGWKQKFSIDDSLNDILNYWRTLTK